MIDNVIKTISEGLRINPQATKIAIGAYIVMALSIALLQLLGDQRVTFWQMLMAFGVLMLVMLALPVLPRLPRVIIGWFIVLAFTLWAGMIVLQTVTGNRIPGIATAKCIATFHMAEGCEVTVASAASNAAVIKEVVADPAEAGSLTTIPADGRQDRRVFVQFAGYERPAMVQFSQALAARGWKVAGGDQGGELIGSAAGRNEVRFFNAADRAVAEALALDTSANLPQTAAIGVVDMTGTRYAKPGPGHLELWISPQTAG